MQISTDTHTIIRQNTPHIHTSPLHRPLKTKPNRDILAYLGPPISVTAPPSAHTHITPPTMDVFQNSLLSQDLSFLFLSACHKKNHHFTIISVQIYRHNLNLYLRPKSRSERFKRDAVRGKMSMDSVAVPDSCITPGVAGGCSSSRCQHGILTTFLHPQPLHPRPS